MCETTYLALLRRAPLLSVEYADSTYVVFMELLDHAVPAKYVAMFVGYRSKVEPLGNESTIAGGLGQSILNPSRDVE